MASGMTQTTISEAARIIDRLIVLLPTKDFNAVDDALNWLRRHALDDAWLTASTRDLMESGDD